MSNKRECPPDFSPPPSLTMPWMKSAPPSTTPSSVLSKVANSPQRSQLLQCSIAAAKPQVKMKTAEERARLDLANCVR